MIKNVKKYVNSAYGHVNADGKNVPVFQNAIVRLTVDNDPCDGSEIIKTAFVWLAITRMDTGETREEKFNLRAAVGTHAADGAFADMVNDCGEESICEMFSDSKAISVTWWPEGINY
jgi:hypothetical protein